MLGLYCLGFCLIQIVRIIASENKNMNKGLQFLLMCPVIAYIMINMKIVKPITIFLQNNLQSLIGG